MLQQRCVNTRICAAVQAGAQEDRCAGGTVTRRAAAPTLRMGCNFAPFP